MRPSSKELLIWPKLGEAMVLPGSANCSALKQLMDLSRIHVSPAACSAAVSDRRVPQNTRTKPPSAR